MCIRDRSQPACGASASGVRPVTESLEKLGPRVGPKIVKKACFAPAVLHTKRGETVLDFGQNMTGWVEFFVDQPAGKEVVLTYGEVLQDDCFYRDNLRTAKSEYRYICLLYTSSGVCRKSPGGEAACKSPPS